MFVRLSCQGGGAVRGTAQLHRGKVRLSVCGAARVASASGMEATVTDAQCRWLMIDAAEPQFVQQGRGQVIMQCRRW